MADVSRTIQIDDLSPKELALLVAELSPSAAADFFNELGWMMDEYNMNDIRPALDSDAIWLGESLVGDRPS